jgi:predicted  nucleic acid-binding Zn-ribbon protein
MGLPGLSKHWKFDRLARALGSELLARGALELLWDPCYAAGDPYVGTSDDIESICRWQGAKGALTKALLTAGAPRSAGFIEPFAGRLDSTEPHYQVHDLFQNAPNYVAHNRDRHRERDQLKACEQCGEPYHSSDEMSRYCSPACRTAAWRERQSQKQADVTGRDGHERHRDVTVTSRDAISDPIRSDPIRSDPRVRTEDSLAAEKTAAKPAALLDDEEDRHEGDADPPPVIAVTVPADPLLLTFPTIGTDGHEWYLTQSQVDEWAELYPNLDVLDQCRRALGWVRADKTRRKTKKGMEKFLSSWLNRSTDTSHRGPPRVTGSLKTAGNYEALQRFVNRGGDK